MRQAAGLHAARLLAVSLANWQAHAAEAAVTNAQLIAAAQHWADRCLSDAFVGWWASAQHSIWQRAALARALGFLGDKPLRSAFAAWCRALQWIKHKRSILAHAAHTLKPRHARTLPGIIVINGIHLQGLCVAAPDIACTAGNRASAHHFTWYVL